MRKQKLFMLLAMSLLFSVLSVTAQYISSVPPNYVGFIPQSSTGCPVGSEYITIRMDDEDDNNKSSVSGWTGNITHYSTGTKFGFCRVDGNKFQNHTQDNYVVLQLGTNCPAGSVSIQRMFDNENTKNKHSSSGNIAPNDPSYLPSSGEPRDTEMSFCFFYANPWSGMQSFPNFYVPYGVFAAPSSAWFANGIVHTDDEDTKPPNRELRSNTTGTPTPPVGGKLASCSGSTPKGVSCCSANGNGMCLLGAGGGYFYQIIENGPYDKGQCDCT